MGGRWAESVRQEAPVSGSAKTVPGIAYGQNGAHHVEGRRAGCPCRSGGSIHLLCGRHRFGHSAISVDDLIRQVRASSGELRIPNPTPNERRQWCRAIRAAMNSSTFLPGRGRTVSRAVVSSTFGSWTRLPRTRRTDHAVTPAACTDPHASSSVDNRPPRASYDPKRTGSRSSRCSIIPGVRACLRHAASTSAWLVRPLLLEELHQVRRRMRNDPTAFASTGKMTDM